MHLGEVFIFYMSFFLYKHNIYKDTYIFVYIFFKIILQCYLTHNAHRTYTHSEINTLI